MVWFPWKKYRLRCDKRQTVIATKEAISTPQLPTSAIATLYSTHNDSSKNRDSTLHKISPEKPPFQLS